MTPTTHPQPTPKITILTASICEPQNPGGFGCWAFIALNANGVVLDRRSGCLGRSPSMSNNLAAYCAVIDALRWSLKNAPGGAAEVFTPVKFIADQVNGLAECGALHLLPLRDEAAALLQQGDFKIRWAPKESIAPARRLAEKAYRAARTKEREVT